jgi:protein-S-isoprenylcysteine O-methyltransferase Ste14
MVVRNYVSAASLLAIGWVFYWCVPYYQWYFERVGYVSMACVIAAYLLVLPIFYATFPDSYTPKCRLFWQTLLQLPHRRPTAKEAVALRAVLVKAFFLPLMINWLALHVLDIYDTCRQFDLAANWLHDGYALMLGLIILIDVLCFTIGYSVEHPRLGNEIRSVEPTLLGWMAALACYPPFFLLTMTALNWRSVDHPEFGSFLVEAPIYLLMLLLMSIYTWASIALGFKASNLTHRGIVQSGPYAWVRHPAYVGKNLFWWFGALPWLLSAAATDLKLLFAGLAGLMGWSGIYCLRALTEERHLGQDPEYQAYCRRVPYRFIPGVW